jgi:hypothetical protein
MLTHDTTVVMNPVGPKSGSGTPPSVSDIVNMETDNLLAVAETAGLGVRKQVALKSLVILKSYYLFQVLIILCSRRSDAMVTHVH